MILRKLDLYLAKHFLLTLFHYTLIAIILIFIINFMGTIGEYDRNSINYLEMALLVAYSVPQSLESISPLIIMLASISFLNIHMENHEITAMKSAGYASWHFLRLFMLLSFSIGWVVAIGLSSVSEWCYTGELRLKNKNRPATATFYHTDSIQRHREGLWLRQPNPEHADGYILVNATGADLPSATLTGVQLFFLNAQHKLYKRYQATSMRFINHLWLLQQVDVTLYLTTQDTPIINKRFTREQVSLRTSAIMKQLRREIDRAMQPVDNVSLLHARRIIRDTSVLGTNNHSFIIRYHYLLRLPIFFVVLTLIGYCFALSENQRSGKALYVFLGGIFTGFCLYFLLEVLCALILAGKISILNGIWIPLIISLLLTLFVISEKQT